MGSAFLLYCRLIRLEALMETWSFPANCTSALARYLTVSSPAPNFKHSVQNKCCVGVPICSLFLKGQCHKIFCHFFISWIEAIWAPNKQSKMVLLKNSFSRRYSRNQWLRAVLACAESNFSNFKFEYLRENKFLRKTILVCLSGAQMGSIKENK